MSNEEARIAARRRFGATEKGRDTHRDARLVMWFGRFFQDVRFSFRMLRKHKLNTTAPVSTLGLAIGANTAIFSFVDGVFLSPLPYPDADRIVSVLERRSDGGLNAVSTLNYLDWVEQSTVFQYLAARAGWGAAMTGGGDPGIVGTELDTIGQRLAEAYPESNTDRGIRIDPMTALRCQ